MSGIDGLKGRVAVKLKTLAVPMERIKYTKENFQKLFPQGMVKTPIETVRVFRSQFEKLGERDKGGRKILIGAMRQTLAEPIVIIKSNEEPKKSLYVKSYKIKIPGDILYEKEVPGPALKGTPTEGRAVMGTSPWPKTATTTCLHCRHNHSKSQAVFSPLHRIVKSGS
jgi:hypothetical protein